MSDWTTQAADAIEKSVAAVRDRTVEPAHRAVTKIVYGVLALGCGFTALVLVSVVAFRAATYVIPVWLTWIAFGGIFLGAGLFCWSRRTGGSRA